MKRDAPIRWTRKLLAVALAPFIWFGLISGVSNLTHAEVIPGVVKVAASLVLLAVIWGGRLTGYLESRQVPTSNLIILLVGAVVIAFVELRVLLTTDPQPMGDIEPRRVLVLLNAGGYLILTGIMLWEVLRLARLRR